VSFKPFLLSKNQFFLIFSEFHLAAQGDPEAEMDFSETLSGGRG